MENGKLHNRQGFTLAELLLAIAIILVLAAIAIPSVVNAQRNMHMVELDSAANQIALAAQNQMTSMKVSGTWLGLFEAADASGNGGGALAGVQQARNLPPVSEGGPADASDIFFMTADQARRSGVLTPLSIEESVYDGSYVIEFSRSTATVCGVFYSDGKNGLFDRPSGASTPAETYYANMSSSAGRSQQPRRDANPLVGYYWGTPAGATNTVALQNPNIWIDDNGMLCVENVNETDHPAWKTSVQVTIETVDAEGNTDGKGKFVISGMQSDGTLYTLSLVEDASTDESETFKNEKIYKLGTREGGSSNVYKIDINKLVKDLSADGETSAQVDDPVQGDIKDQIKQQIKEFVPGRNIKVTAKVTAPSMPSIPSTATAYVEWPVEVAKLAVLVTASDDSLYSKDSYDYKYSLATARNGKDKTAFVPVAVAPAQGKELNSPPALEDAEERIKIEGTSSDLLSVDKGAGAQYYQGKQVAYSKVEKDNTMLIEIMPGNTMSASVVAAHYYQIYEIWINDKLVGSIQGVNWKWNINNVDLKLFLDGGKVQPIASEMTVFDDQKKAIYLDQTKLVGLADYGIEPVDGGYTIYVRTAPSIKDIQEYFQDYNVDPFPGMTPNSIASARGEGDSGAVIQKFYSEFHTPSSVALWTAAEGKIEGVSDSKTTDMRFYYAPTPFARVNQGTMDGSHLASSVLWYLERKDGYGQYYYTQRTRYSYIAVGQDYSNVTPAPAGLGAITRPQVGKVGSADFGILPTTDYLYYRSLTYHDGEGKVIDDKGLNQWIPILGFNVLKGTTNADVKFADGPSKEDHLFTGWDTDKAGNGTKFPGGSLLADYRDTLPLGSVSLYAQYVKVGIGVMYLEYSDAEKTQVSGYYGYLDEKENITPSLPTDNTIMAWDYCVVVPAGTAAPTVKSLALGPKKTVVIAGGNFDTYSLTSSLGVDDNRKKKQQVELVATAVNGSITKTGTFYVNFNFAGAVDKDYSRTLAWGQRNENESMQAESAWKVRFATQFPGALYSSSNQSIQTYFAGDCFVQTHSIDMGDVGKNLPPNTKTEHFWFRRTFTGEYDGGAAKGCAITGFETRFEREVNHFLGLFPDTNGASLKNIDLVFEKDIEQSLNWNSFGSIDASFGFLVGNAEGGSIESCRLTPGVNEDTGLAKDALLTFTITNIPINFDNNIGCLVGQSRGVSLQDVSVKNVILEIKSYGNKNWETKHTQRFGSVVGFIDASALNDSFVFEGMNAENVTVSISALSTVDSALALGGLVGYFDTGTNVYSGNSWTTVFVGLRTLPTQDALNLTAGGMVGRVSGAGLVLDAPGSKNSCKTTVLQAGGKNIDLTDVSKWIGKSL